MKTVILDFETYYDKDYNLRNLSYPEFILDPRFKVHGLAVDDGKTQHFFKPEQIPAVLRKLTKSVIVVHNGYFDIGILRWKYKFNAPVFLDTLLMANHVLGSNRDGGGGRNDLDSLATRIGFEGKTRAVDFKGVRDLTPLQFEQVAAYARNDARLTREIYEWLEPRISNPEFELWLIDHTLRLYTDRSLEIDPKKLRKIVAIVRKRQAEIVRAGGVTQEVLRSDKQFGQELCKRLEKHKLKLPMKRGKNGPIPALAKGDPAFAAMVDSEHADVSQLVRARLVEKSSTTILARVRTMQRYVELGIGIPVHLVYYGAHTGRFAGGGGFNFQNLTSPARAVDPLDAEIATMVREAILPGDKRVFVADDAAQIEARVLAWLAGEQHVLDTFASGADVYSKFISGAIDEDIHKPTNKDPAERRPYLTLMRQVGKAAVLGLGFSMGVEKFRGALEKDKTIRPHLKSDGILNEQACATIVYGYRKQHPNIVQFWDDLNNAFQSAIRGGRQRVGFLLFERVDNRDVAIVLPSGRRLYYRNIRRVPRTGKTEYIGADGQRHEKEREGFEWVHGNGQRIYGGLLAENVTQAVARDILAETIYAAEEKGYPVVLHVHDEIVCRVGKHAGEKCLAFLDASLRNPPLWAPGLVLGSEGHVAENLSK